MKHCNSGGVQSPTSLREMTRVGRQEGHMRQSYHILQCADRAVSTKRGEREGRERERERERERGRKVGRRDMHTYTAAIVCHVIRDKLWY